MSVRDELSAVFDRAGAAVCMHAREVDGDGEVGIGADEPVVTASVFKIPVLLEVARQAAAGELDLTERVRVPAGRRTIGPTGISVMLDDVDVSVRDLAFFMMSVSDNTATDVLMERVGADRIAATLRSLGLEQTALPEDCATLLSGFATDLGIDLDAPDETLSFADIDAAVYAKARALIPAETNRTTPREMTALLSMIWRDEAGPPEACAEVRRIMALQVWPHRLTSGFPDGVAVAGKTGTLPGIRNEAGVVTYPDGARYAVAVFTRARSYASQQPHIDAAIGTAAKAAVDHIRSLASFAR